MDSETRAHKQREAAELLAERRTLDATCIREGGFLCSDPRLSRLLDLGEQVDAIQAELLLADLGFDAKPGAGLAEAA